MNDKDFNKKFAEDLQDFLIDYLGDASEEVCRWAGCSMIHESIEMFYQNAPNKERFEEVYMGLVNRIFTLWKDQLPEGSKLK